MEQDWKKCIKFIDEIGTVFERVGGNPNYDYRFVTVDGDTDFCTEDQMVDWGVQLDTTIDC